MHIVSLAGWGCDPCVMEPLVNQLSHSQHTSLDYLATPDLASILQKLGRLDPDLIIGWSLGGQLACEAIALGMIEPKQLVLISTAWQFVADDAVPDAMPSDQYKQFKQHFATDPQRTLSYMHGLVMKGDSKAEYLTGKMVANEADPAILAYWLHQLPTLGRDICRTPLPKQTLVVHGSRDAIVPVTQASYFHAHQPDITQLILPQAGHAPHMHASPAVADAITLGMTPPTYATPLHAHA